MLYTVVALEDVLEGIDSDPSPTMELPLGGATLEVEALGDFQARIVRVLSTDPSHYLNVNYQPGSVIRWDVV